MPTYRVRWDLVQDIEAEDMAEAAAKALHFLRGRTLSAVSMRVHDVEGSEHVIDITEDPKR